MGHSRLEQSRDSMRQEDLRSNEALMSSLTGSRYIHRYFVSGYPKVDLSSQIPVPTACQ